MIRATLCGITVAAALCAAPAMARSFDGTWHGRMTCAKLSFTKGPQHVRFDLTVANSKASFARKVYNQDNSAVVGSEEGSGPVAGDGTIKLTATWKAAKADSKYSYTATYTGKLSAHAAHLSGTQVWTHAGKHEDRRCTVAFTR